LSAKRPDQLLGIIQPPITSKWVPRYFCGIKRPGRDVEVRIYSFMVWTGMSLPFTQ